MVGAQVAASLHDRVYAEEIVASPRGVVADGVTALLIRVQVPGRGCVTFRIKDDRGSELPDAARAGTLSTIGGNETGITSLTVDAEYEATKDGWFAFAVLTSPLDFVRDGDVGDEDRLRGLENPRVIHLEGEYRMSCGASDPIDVEFARCIELHRPPVILLHGVWSCASRWTWDILHDPRFFVYPHDYMPTHADPLMNNTFEVAQAIDVARYEMQQRGIACTQADVVGHSMGGLLARLYVSEQHECPGNETCRGQPDISTRTRYRRDDNFQKGDIHKLITLDTPHGGSPLANVIANPDCTGTVFGDAFAVVGGLGTACPKDGPSFENCVDCGAGRDLRIDSNCLCNLKEAVVPSHAMYGVGPVPTTELKYDLILGWWHRIQPSVPPSLAHLFAGQPHDTIVAAPSQLGGLPVGGFAVREFTGSASEHGPQTDNPEANQHALFLLNTDVGSSFFADGFPSRSCPATSNHSEAATEPLVLGDAIAITMPTTGDTVVAGETIEVAVEPVDVFEPATVLILASIPDVQVVDTMPFVASVDVPVGASGAVVLRAYAIDVNGVLAVSNDVIVSVAAPANLVGLTVQPAQVSLNVVRSSQQVSVLGHFDDGVDRDLTSQGTGTHYEVGNTVIASVGTGGRISANLTGRTTLTVSNEGVETIVEIEVASSRFDWNSDARIDLGDHRGMAACMSGPQIASTSLLCRQVFDADGDRNVDLADWARFSVTFAPGICGNGVLETGEECDPPESQYCASNCQRIPFCGDGLLDESEDCDPPELYFCDDSCRFIK